LALARAEEAKRTYQLQDLHGGSGRVMCPLNFNGLCGLYDHRPMICRLHGIPHRLHKPGGPEQKGPGCGRFHKETQAGDHYGHEFDRTEFYSGMAAIEIGLRRRLNFRGRYRKTIADMVLDILNGDG
jgi:Fe-S-cluster containining protein